jgi:hypothetical protein
LIDPPAGQWRFLHNHLNFNAQGRHPPTDPPIKEPPPPKIFQWPQQSAGDDPKAPNLENTEARMTSYLPQE